MPRMLRFLLTHAVIGIGVGWVCLGALIAINGFGLRDLIAASPDGGLALALLAFLFALTFGSVGMGFGVMGQAFDDGDWHGAPRKRDDDRPLS